MERSWGLSSATAPFMHSCFEAHITALTSWVPSSPERQTPKPYQSCLVSILTLEHGFSLLRVSCAKEQNPSLPGATWMRRPRLGDTNCVHSFCLMVLVEEDMATRQHELQWPHITQGQGGKTLNPRP